MIYHILMLAALCQAPIKDVGFPQWHWVQTKTSTGQWTDKKLTPSWGVLQSDGRVRPATTPPTVPPPTVPPTNGIYENCGVDIDRLSKVGEKFRSSGPASAAFVESVQEGRLVDDSRKFHLTVIGTKDEQEAVKAKLNSGPSRELLADFHVQYYLPSDWEVKDAKFKLDGHPSLLIQLPEGQSVWQSEAFPGDEKMVAGINYAKSKLRNPDPNYDPSKVPGPNGGGGSAGHEIGWVEWLASLATIIGVLHVIKNNRNSHAD